MSNKNEDYIQAMEKYDKQIEDFKKRTLPWTESTDIKAWIAEEKRLLKQRKDAAERYWNNKKNE